MGKRKRKWSTEEVEALLAGFEKHGSSNWKLILSDPQFSSSFINRSNIDLKDKWRNIERDRSNSKKKNEAARRDCLMHSPSRAIKKRSIKQILEDLSNSEDNHMPCTINRQRSGTHTNMKNQTSEEIVVEEFSDSEDYQTSEEIVVEEFSDSEDYETPCPITPQRSGTHNNTINQFSEEIVVEEFSDSEDDHNPSTITPERSGTRNDTTNQFSENVVVEELSDSEDDHDPCTTSRKKSGTHNNMINQFSETIVVEELSDSEDNQNPCTSGTDNNMINQTSRKRVVKELNYSPSTISRQRRGTRRNSINQDRKLDSKKVHRYLESLWLSFPEDKKSSCIHLDPLWYTIYSEDSNKERVLNWIRKDIFSTKYVFFPIVLWGHWSVLIFCHFGESLESKLKTPCILLLDSLAQAGHCKQLEPMIRKFVLDINKTLERTGDIKLLQTMPFLVPKVPQQRDGEECGYFVLYYTKLFVENAPESFSITDGYPYFMKKDWFNFEEFDSFCRTVDTTLV